MFKKLARSLGLGGSEIPKAVVVQYGKNSYRIEFEDGDFAGDQGATAGFLREKVSEVIGMPEDKITLVHAGKKLTVDRVALKDYGVMTDAKILVIASSRQPAKSAPAPTPAPAPAPAPVRLTPAEQMQKVVDQMDTDIKPWVDRFLSSPGDADEHHRLSETILQKMFMLDDVDVSDNSELRQQRRDIINGMHKVQARLDEAFKAANTNEE